SLSQRAFSTEPACTKCPPFTPQGDYRPDCSPTSSAIQARYSGKWHKHPWRNRAGRPRRIVDKGWEMQKIGATLHFSSGDLVGHLNCRYLTELDLKVANGELKKPRVWDPVLETLAERGALHEQDFIKHLKAVGATVT